MNGSANSMEGKQRVLCYVRPWSREHFVRLAREVFPGAEVVACSEHASVDECGLRAAYYRELAGDAPARGLLSPVEEADLIARCRLLRKLPHATATRHLRAMAVAVDELLQREQPSHILSLTVDSFVIDLLRLLSARDGIPFTGLVGCFVNGCFRVTSRGESHLNPAPVVDALLAMKARILDPAYTPAFNRKALASPRLGAMRRWALNLARVPYFFARRHLSGDRYNYHYWSSEVVSRGHATLFPPRDPGTTGWKRRLDDDRRPKVFVPLQMFPECTIDYWCEDREAIDYYARLEDFIASHHRDVLIVVKEHPSVYPSRPPGFYAKLARDPRVVVVPTYAHSNAVLAEVEGVLVWTGTVGFEAALRGKAVLSMSNSYYVAGDRFLKIDTTTPSADILGHLARCRAAAITDAQQSELLVHLASRLYRGAFVNDGSWRPDRERDLEDLGAMAASLKPLAGGA